MVLTVFLTGALVVDLSAQAASSLVQALEANPVQAAYLARHPEILRWIAKHPDLDHPAKNPTINAWVTAQPDLARLLANDPDQTLSWAEEPRSLAELAKKGRE